MFLRMKTLFLLALLSALVPGALRAQDPIALIQGPNGITPLAYHQLAQEANRLYHRRDFAAAAQAYARLAEAYPWDGETWYRLAYARYQQREYRAAAEAFRKADELGVPAYARALPEFAARAHARAGEPDSALAWLKKAFEEYHRERPVALLQDSTFRNLREDPRFRSLAGPRPDPSASRVEGWRTDLDYLLTQIRRFNPVYRERPLPDSIVQAAARLRERIPSLSDVQIAIEMQHLLAMLGQAHHTFAFPYLPDDPKARVRFTQLPVTFHLFPEGVYIIDADSSHRDLIGARVLRFDQTLAERAVRATAYMKERENDVELAQGAPIHLALPQVLHALGVIRDPARVQLSIIDRRGRTRTVRLDPVPNQGGQRKLDAPRLPGAAAAPLYLSRPADPFWFEPLPGTQTVYVQFNDVADTRAETLAQFGLRLRKFLAEHPDVQNLIVDMRRNNGGSTYLYPELLRTLIAFDAQEGNRLFVLIGRKTFSAASNFITELDRLSNAVFVGEPSGGKPIMTGGDQTFFVLPYSEMQFIIAGSSWKLTSERDTRLWIAPDIPVALTAEDYFANRDPVLETVRTLIHKRGQ